MNYNIDTEENESTFEDLKELYEITTVEQIHDLLGDPILLDRYVHNFDYLYDRVVDVASLCWNNRDDKGTKLQFTFIKFKKSLEDPVTYELPLNRFMMSLVFLRTVIDHLQYIDINDFILQGYLTKKGRGKIQDKIVETLTGYGKTIRDIQVIMSKMSLDLKELLLVFSAADMQVFTAENLFLDHYRESQIIRDINNTEYPPTMQTSEIVEANKEKYKLLEAEMIKRKNPFFLADKYTSILKPKQMEELYINFSQIPDGKDIVPVIMNGNGFRAGYHDLPVMYAGAIAARVPDIMNEEYMGSAGYFARNLWILTYGTLSKTVWDCGSVNPIELEIDECMLEMMDGRYYQERKNVGPYKIFDKKDTSLLGKKLWFRSPCTCNLNEDCCHVCYGTKALKVGDLEGGFIYTTEIATSKVQQNVLSVKHILKTNAEKIVGIDDNFNDYFVLDSSQIYPQDIKFDMFIREDYTDHISEYFEMFVSKKLIPIKITNYASCHVNDELFDKEDIVEIKGVRYYKLNSKTVLGTNRPICDIIPVNIAETQKYMNIMNMFESKLSSYTRIEDAVNDLNAMFKNTIPLLSTHGEIMISKHIRQKDNRMLRPNFLKPNAEYQILNLRMALQNSESVATALAFEHTKAHLMQSISETREDIKSVGARSFIDYLLGEEVL